MSERPPLDEATLRETRDDLLTRLVDQARITPDVLRDGLGVDPTSTISLDQYVTQRVIPKAEVRHRELQREDRARSITSIRDPMRGQPRHEGTRIIRGRADAEGIVVEGPNIRAARRCFAEMRELALQHGDATWTHQMDAIKAANLPANIEDEQLKQLLYAYVQKYGDPRIRPERPVEPPPARTGNYNPWRRVGKRADWATYAPRLASVLGL